MNEPIPLKYGLESYGFLLLDLTDENNSILYKYPRKVMGKIRRKEAKKKCIITTGNANILLSNDYGTNDTTAPPG